MESEATRALVEKFLEARSANDGDAMVPLLADDVVWAPPVSAGIGPFSGRDDVIAALTGGAVGKFLDVSTIQRTVHKLVVEDDTAVAFQRMTATTSKGTEYDNEYAWRYTCADGKISRLDEYADTLRAAKIFGFV